MFAEQQKESKNISEFQDHSYLIKKCYDLLYDAENNFTEYKWKNIKDLKKTGFNKKKKGKSFIVMAEDTSVELGSPENISISCVLWTKENLLIKNSIWIAGKELSQIKGKSVSFLQVIMIQPGDEDDPTDPLLQGLKNLSNKIPGLMTRSITGKMWIRIHKDLMKKKFTLYSLGKYLHEAYKESMPNIKGIDIILCADDPQIISKFEPIYKTTKIINGENQKLKWVEDGVVSCEELNCNTCEEQPACDIIKDIVVKRKK